MNGPFSSLCALAALIVCVLLQFLVSRLCIFRPQVFLDPIRRVLSKFQLALSNHIYLLLFETSIVTLNLLAYQNRWWGNAFSGCKWVQNTELNVVNESFYNYVRWLFGWHYISSLPSADESQEGRNNCSLSRSCVIGSCHVDIWKRLWGGVSLAVYFLSRISQSEGTSERLQTHAI